MSSIGEKMGKVWERLKKIKHIEIYLTVGFAIIIIAIYLSTLGGGKKTESQDSTENQQNFSSSVEYVDYLENKLESVLASVRGAGQVNVVITLDSGFEYVYASKEETKTRKVTTSQLIMVDGKPVLEKEIYPTIKGIVVTSSGAENVSVKMNLLTALQTVVNVPNQNITILTGN